jgi:hypothetical protein
VPGVFLSGGAWELTGSIVQEMNHPQRDPSLLQIPNAAATGPDHALDDADWGADWVRSANLSLSVQ